MELAVIASAPPGVAGDCSQSEGSVCGSAIGGLSLLMRDMTEPGLAQRHPRSEHPVPPTDWPAIVLSILEAAERGQAAAAAAGVSAARRLAGAEYAAVVQWVQGHPHALWIEGAEIKLPSRRPEDTALIARRPALVARLDEFTDLIVARSPGAPPFEPEVAKAIRAVARLLVRAGDRSREALATLYEVATKILASLDLDEVLLSVTNAALWLLGAQLAGILLLESDTSELVMRCTAGHLSAGTARMRIHRGQGLAGKVLESGRSERVEDYLADPSISSDFARLASQEGTRSALCAPMRAPTGVVGALFVGRRRRSAFTDDEARLLEALGDLATVAVENARLYEAERGSAEELRQAHEELKDQYQSAEQALRIHQELTRVALEGDNLAEALEVLRRLTGGAAALIDDELRVVADCPEGTGSDLVRKVGTALKDQFSPGDLSRVIKTRGRFFVVALVRAAGLQFGHLCVGLRRTPSSEDLVAAEQAAIVCALLLAREEAAVFARRRLQSEFVWDLLEGRVPDEAAALVRARHLGQAFELPARVLLVSIEGLEELVRSKGWGPEQLERARARAALALADRVQDLSAARPVVAHRANLLAAVVPRSLGDSAGSARDLGRAALSAAPFSSVRQIAGVSGIVQSVAAIAEGFRQAQFALAAAAGLEESCQVFEDLGILQFLFWPPDKADLSRLVEGILGPIIEYDRQHNVPLLRTLQAYLAADCHLKQAAQSLYVHEKTVRYRLQRVEDLTGLRIDRQEDRFNIQLALKVLRLNDKTARPGA